MGEIAEMMLDGTMGPETGEFNFEGEDGPGWPMTGAEAEQYRRDTAPVSPPHRLRGDWALVGRCIGEGEALLADLERELEMEPRKLRGVLGAMTAANLTRRQGKRVWLTQRGISAWKKTT